MNSIAILDVIYQVTCKLTENISCNEWNVLFQCTDWMKYTGSTVETQQFRRSLMGYMSIVWRVNKP